MRRQVWFGLYRHERNMLMPHRDNCQTDCGAQPFRPRRCMGSSKRICSNPILGSVRSHIHPKDQGRPIRTAQQSFKNGPPITANFVEQSSTSRLRSRLIRSRKYISWYRVTNSVGSWNTTKSRAANESPSHLTQSTVVVWLIPVNETIRFSCSFTSIACGHARQFS
jgi:hypothetical protein